MNIDKILTGNGSPVSHDFFLYMFHFEGLAQKRIIQQIKLRCAEIVGGTPVGVHLFQIFVCKRQSFFDFHMYLLFYLFYAGILHNVLDPRNDGGMAGMLFVCQNLF